MLRIKRKSVTGATIRVLLCAFSLIFLINSSVFAFGSTDLQSIISNTPFYDPNACGNSNPTTVSGITAGSSVYVLGDSITERSQSQYQTAFNKAGVTGTINAEASRGLNTPGIDGDKSTGMQAILNDSKIIQKANYIVIALGTNGGNTNQSVDAAIASIKGINPTAPIYWVDTIVVYRPSYAPVIEQANQAIYSQSTTQGFTVAQWFKTVDLAGDPQHLTGSETDTNQYIDNGDGLGVHPTPAGSSALVGVVMSTLNTATKQQGQAAANVNCSCPNTPSASGGSTTNVPIDGNNVKDAFVFFEANGFSGNQSAGITGNLMYESGGVNPTRQEVGGGGGYGIAQFTPPTGLETWAAANNQDYTTLQAQLGYLNYEFNNNESGAAAATKATTNIADATTVFMNKYERPNAAAGAASLNERIADAQSAYNMYAGASGGGQTTGGSGCSAAAGSTSPNCTGATGDALILCTAQQYAGIYYNFGSGHSSYSNFRAGCPLSTLPSVAAQSTVANPGPCATDCSGLISMAVDQAFNQDFVWTVNGAMSGSGAQFWTPVPPNQVQPGDIVTTSGHVEIVDHYDATKNTVYTFGSHQTGTQTGPSSAGPGYYTGAYRWTGPGSS